MFGWRKLSSRRFISVVHSSRTTWYGLFAGRSVFSAYGWSTGRALVDRPVLPVANQLTHDVGPARADARARCPAPGTGSGEWESRSSSRTALGPAQHHPNHVGCDVAIDLERLGGVEHELALAGPEDPVGRRRARRASSRPILRSAEAEAFADGGEASLSALLCELLLELGEKPGELLGGNVGW